MRLTRERETQIIKKHYKLAFATACTTLGVCVATQAVKAVQAGKGPAQVFIFVGQSSTEVEGSIRHLDELKSDPEIAKVSDHLKNKARAVGRGRRRIGLLLRQEGEPDSQLRQAAAGVVEMAEFNGNVKFVRTTSYRRTEPRFDGGFHYNSNAGTFYPIGDAFHKHTIELLKSDRQVDIRSPSPCGHKEARLKQA